MDRITKNIQSLRTDVRQSENTSPAFDRLEIFRILHRMTNIIEGLNNERLRRNEEKE